jgi:4-amino-4-deoxy-L-arabinose transferase-like glycosyltransferase
LTGNVVISRLLHIPAGAIHFELPRTNGSATVRPEHYLYIILALHIAFLSVVALLTQPTLPLDVVEQLAWAHDPQWVYFKHPPLPAWTLWLVEQTTFHSLWAAAIVGPAATALTIWIVFRLASRIVDPARALIAAAALEGIIYFNYTALEFNHNVVQMPVWALIALFGHRAYRDGKPGDWLGVGISAAIGMLAKYSSVLMIASLVAAFIADPQARKTFKSYGPWLAILTTSVILIPHLLALAHIHFAPFDFPLERAAPAASMWDHLLNPASFLLAQFVDVVAALALLALALVPKGGEIALQPMKTRKSDRQFIYLIALGPICLSLGLESISGVRFLDMWGTPMWDFLGLAAAVAASGRVVTVPALRRFTVMWCMVFAFAIVTRAVVDVADPYVTGKGGRIQYPAHALASVIEHQWHDQMGNHPLDIVAGNGWYGGMITVYAYDHPSLMIDGECWKSPWISDVRLSRSGAVLIWPLDRASPEKTKMLQEFPHALLQKPLVLSFETTAHIRPAQFGWAIVPPHTAVSVCGK